jgi:hypothetical protein
MIELTVLAVPGCPGAAMLRELLPMVLAGRPDTRVTWREVTGEQDAARLGMRGSPTLLVDGVDPFAEPGSPASLSCRLYRDPPLAPANAPSLARLREVMGTADRT